uniref:Ribosomal eL28/Mak16 domain-containing protein n=1 Tax=Ostreococcus mediterraneus TaxID=1486918 RepID=A0A7S0T9X0_9CHLO|mmetsp:Transcript_1758/g.5614  ORF Transcript_1758/g.5614 Transcript_1758/m.5614 type:complete len:212 (+) Transcript_1758:434-1069(+)
MQSDEVVWQIINHSHCCFKANTDKNENFCRNAYNVTGLCNRSSCPLANSQYATVVEENGSLQLVMKSVERAHLPSNLWKTIELSTDYTGALEQISVALKHWPKFLVHKNKQRLTKLAQYLIRSRRIEKNTRAEIVTMPSRDIKRENRKEAKAEKAARIQSSIEKQLLERLNDGTYNSAYKFSTSQYLSELQSDEEKRTLLKVNELVCKCRS